MLKKFVCNTKSGLFHIIRETGHMQSVYIRSFIADFRKSEIIP